MRSCPKCGGRLVRSHRRAYEKPCYSEMFICMRCEGRTGRWHTRLWLNAALVLSRHSRCPRCARFDVHAPSKADRIDSKSRHPLSVVQRLLFAPLKKCGPCRLQFYDWRPIKAGAVDDVRESAGVNHPMP